jgi:hypothetical protein
MKANTFNSVQDAMSFQIKRSSDVDRIHCSIQTTLAFHEYPQSRNDGAPFAFSLSFHIVSGDNT